MTTATLSISDLPPGGQSRAHPFARKVTKALIWEIIFKWVFRIATYLVLAAATYIFLDIGIKGSKTVFRSEFPFVNVPFFTEWPETLHIVTLEDGQHLELGDKAFRQYFIDHPAAKVAEEKTQIYAAGGIYPAIVGTFLLVIGSMIIALFFGITSAVYLSEYSKPGKIISIIRLSIMNLAGVPSIVFGMFGAAMFVLYFKWNISLLSGWFTLAFCVLPIIITAAEESLRAVPKGFREGSLALGATKWQTIRQNVLPYALPGILTSSVLGIARVAGETAPIMFTAAYVVRDQLPWQGLNHWTDFFFNGVMALPYHIFVVSARVPQNEYTEKVQYGTAFVFLFIVMAIALASIILRNKVRGKYKW